MSTNVPVSVWRTTSGNNENEYTGTLYIVDPQNTYLVDPQGTYIVDTGIEMPIIPSTVWIENDGV